MKSLQSRPLLILLWLASSAFLIPGEGGLQWLTHGEIVWGLEQEEESQERSEEEQVKAEEGATQDHLWANHAGARSSADDGWLLYGGQGEAAGHASITDLPPEV